MRIILIIAVIIAAFFLFAILTIIKDQLEEYKKIRDEDNQRKQYWSKVDYYKKRMKHPFCEGLASVNIDGKYGYINEYYDVVIQPQYDDAGSFYNGTALVKKGGMECVIDKTGNVLFVAFDYVSDDNDFARVRIRNKWAIIDKKTLKISQMQFELEEMLSFSEGLAPVKVENKWGYIAITGLMLIKPQFECACQFSEGLAPVKRDGKWGYIDKTSEFVINPQFDWAGRFYDGLAEVRGDKKGIINVSGKYIINPIFTENDILPSNSDLSKGYGFARLNDTWWYFNNKNKRIQFEDADGFSEGLAAVKIKGLWGYIDETGLVVISPQFSRADRFRNSFATVTKDDLPMIITKGGKIVLTARDFPNYSSFFKECCLEIVGFHEGLAEVFFDIRNHSRTIGYINEEGSIAIQPHYFDCGAFSEGLAPVCCYKEGRYGFIDKSGKYIIEPAFEYACSFSEGLAKIVKNKKSGGRYTYINKAGEEVIKTKFWSAEDFSGGMALVSIKLKDDVIKYGFINKQGYSAFDL